MTAITPERVEELREVLIDSAYHNRRLFQGQTDDLLAILDAYATLSQIFQKASIKDDKFIISIHSVPPILFAKELLDEHQKAMCHVDLEEYKIPAPGFEKLVEAAKKAFAPSPGPITSEGMTDERLEKNEQEKAGATELCPVCSGTRVYGTVTGGTNPAPCYACAGRGYTTPDAPSPGPITSEDEWALAVVAEWAKANPWSVCLKQTLAHLRSRLAGPRVSQEDDK